MKTSMTSEAIATSVQDGPGQKQRPLPSPATIDRAVNRPWHTQTAAEVSAQLGVEATTGLQPGEARERLARVGSNVLAEARRESWLGEVVESLTEPLQLLLIVVAVAYAVLGKVEDAITIFVVILVVAMSETFSELRAIAALSTLSAPTASLIRAGMPVEIAATDVVPGDVVLLEPGDRIVADLRLVETVALRVDKSSLTGESHLAALPATTWAIALAGAILFPSWWEVLKWVRWRRQAPAHAT